MHTLKRQNRPKMPKLNDAGSLMLLIILLLSFAMLVGLPVLRLVMIEYTASINQQISLKTYYLAEAGLVRGQQLMRFNVNANLPAGEQALGNGFFYIERVAGNKLRATGQIGKAKTTLSLTYDAVDLSKSNVLLVGNERGEGVYCNLGDSAQVFVTGNALVLGDINFLGEGAQIDLTGQMMLKGEVVGEGEILPKPKPTDNLPDDELWRWLQYQLLRSGQPLPLPLAGRITLLPGVTYDCLTADWRELELVGPAGVEAAATLLIRGDLDLGSCSGNLNVIVAGDCRQVSGATTTIQGVMWVQGELTVQSFDLQGALLAGSVFVPAGELLVRPFPGQHVAPGLVVPSFSNWVYVFN